MDREPCPYRIVDDVGGAFCMGGIGGGIWHYFKGLRNAPKGARVQGGIAAVKARAPVLGGAFAIWGLCFASFDCSIAAIRKKEDPWNAILSGACTGGLLAIRAGPKAAGKNALIGGVVLAMIEGASIAITKAFAPKASTPEEMAGMPDPTAPPTAPGLFPGMGYFGGSSAPSGQGYPEDTAGGASPSFDPYGSSSSNSAGFGEDSYSSSSNASSTGGFFGGLFGSK